MRTNNSPKGQAVDSATILQRLGKCAGDSIDGDIEENRATFTSSAAAVTDQMAANSRAPELPVITSREVQEILAYLPSTAHAARAAESQCHPQALATAARPRFRGHATMR
jgi:hypothetical protein